LDRPKKGISLFPGLVRKEGKGEGNIDIEKKGRRCLLQRAPKKGGHRKKKKAFVAPS